MIHTLPLASASWQFREVAPRAAWFPAVVPGCVHTDLLRADLIPEPFVGTNELDVQWIEEREWEYRTEFTAPADLRAAEVIELVADGLDTVATVTLNGHVVAQTENMFVAHRWDVAALLRPGRNRLVIRFHSALDYIRTHRTEFSAPQEFNDPVGNSVRIRKQACQFGWDWGPRFVTCGIWRDLRLEAWSANRLAHVHVTQHHHTDGGVSLALAPALARPDPSATHEVTLSLDGQVVYSGDGLDFAVPAPRLWWPAGQGEQALYDLEITSRDATGRELGTLKKRLGLRTIALDQSPDAAGRRFQFVVNGRPVFMKGANFIPVHSFVAGLTRADYARDLQAAVDAHMNCVRLWGGGIYESEHFYDLCDELGLLVWHDMMFACSLYPSDEAFLASVADEITCQARRLHHRACIALWCGNNELVQLNGHVLRDNPAQRAGYEALFDRVIPAALAAHAPATPYVPSSEWRGTYETGHALGEKCGDTHYWDVWHARHPVKDYEKWRFRFCSEFGMQSYSSSATNATFAPPDANLFGAVMENHQKNRGGNQVILDYVTRRYRFPKSQDDLIYLSQLNQAYCMQIGVEHYRRTLPHCMGAIYWQLNDCWPVASWSSIEHTGRWRALHHAARRFNAPALVSVHIPGDESVVVGNYRRSSVREAHIYTVFDAPTPTTGELRWQVRHLDGSVVLSGRRRVRLAPLSSTIQTTLDLAPVLARHGRDHVYLRVTLETADHPRSEETIFLTPPRFLELPRGKITATLRKLSPTEQELTLVSPVFQHRVEVELPGLDHALDDNFLELYPEEPRTLRLTLAKPTRQTPAALQKRLRLRSLVDTY